MFDRILVFAAHADDEISMANSIARFSNDGTEVTVVNTTDGSEGYPDPSMQDEIVAMRRKEAMACDEVLGILHRIILDNGDQGGLIFDKPTLQEFIRIIREVRPNAIFTHGPEDRHVDHRQTSAISVDAWWHAGQPVAAALGEQWKTPCLYYYKGIHRTALPSIELDVTETAHKRLEALATQESQFTLFRSSREEFLARAEEVKAKVQKTTDTYWIHPHNRYSGFPEA